MHEMIDAWIVDKLNPFHRDRSQVTLFVSRIFYCILLSHTNINFQSTNSA
jgi:hypothetical protein